jgi:hypothetical protein
MKTTNKFAEATRNFDQLISKFSENHILNIQEMSYVKGGDGEAAGGSPVIIIPK